MNEIIHFNWHIFLFFPISCLFDILHKISRFRGSVDSSGRMFLGFKCLINVKSTLRKKCIYDLKSSKYVLKHTQTDEKQNKFVLKIIFSLFSKNNGIRLKARRLIISMTSPISKTNIIFANTQLSKQWQQI